jgi:hypothetical protein
VFHLLTVQGPLTINSGNGDDTISIEKTNGPIAVTSGVGSHNFTIADTVGNVQISVGDGNNIIFVVETRGDISFYAGVNAGIGVINIEDTTEGDIIIMTAGGLNNDIDIINTDDGSVSVNIGPGSSTIDIISTSENIFIEASGAGEDVINLFEIGGNIEVKTWDDDDLINVDRLAGNLFIDVGAGDDVIDIDALGGNGTVLGGLGNDLLLLDGRDSDNVEELHNTMDGSHLNWNGGGGDDTVELYYVSAGTTNLNIIDDNLDVNQVIVRCSDLECTILSRSTFLANIHNPNASNTSLERINLDETASVTSLLLYLNGGENNVHFDDTFAVMDVFGGDEKDSFFVGQMFNDDRTTAYGVSTTDPIQTTLTTKGYLSDGCSHPITVNGGKQTEYDYFNHTVHALKSAVFFA